MCKGKEEKLADERLCEVLLFKQLHFIDRHNMHQYIIFCWFCTGGGAFISNQRFDLLWKPNRVRVERTSGCWCQRMMTFGQPANRTLASTTWLYSPLERIGTGLSMMVSVLWLWQEVIAHTPKKFYIPSGMSNIQAVILAENAICGKWEELAQGLYLREVPVYLDKKWAEMDDVEKSWGSVGGLFWQSKNWRKQ